MKAKGTLLKTVSKAMAESMDTDMMVNLVREHIPTYDINKQTGFSYNLSIPSRVCARQIINDINDEDLFPSFMLMLIKLHRNGYYGRPLKIPYMKQIMQGIRSMGLLYDINNHIFGEDPSVRRTRNWSVLRNGEEAIITLLKIDIVGNTELVKHNNQKLIEDVYSFLRQTVFQNVEKRNGRIWNWEGDGGIGAFYFGSRAFYGLMCAINILHEIEYFNIFCNQLDRPVQVRFALHDEKLVYYEDETRLLNNNEAIKYVIKLESKYTQPNSITLSSPVTTSYDAMTKGMFEKFRGSDKNQYFRYHVTWDE